ncbi:hypothetical protein DFH06DRAFT_1150592 [Mycena polygramma]|nr:hypothetical protein DFH06DRAFT_1150592 [Mycena polygramma]
MVVATTLDRNLAEMSPKPDMLVLSGKYFGPVRAARMIWIRNFDIWYAVIGQLTSRCKGWHQQAQTKNRFARNLDKVTNLGGSAALCDVSRCGKDKNSFSGCPEFRGCGFHGQRSFAYCGAPLHPLDLELRQDGLGAYMDNHTTFPRNQMSIYGTTTSNSTIQPKCSALPAGPLSSSTGAGRSARRVVARAAFPVPKKKLCKSIFCAWERQNGALGPITWCISLGQSAPKGAKKDGRIGKTEQKWARGAVEPEGRDRDGDIQNVATTSDGHVERAKQGCHNPTTAYLTALRRRGENGSPKICAHGLLLHVFEAVTLSAVRPYTRSLAVHPFSSIARSRPHQELKWLKLEDVPGYEPPPLALLPPPPFLPSPFLRQDHVSRSRERLVEPAFFSKFSGRRQANPRLQSQCAGPGVGRFQRLGGAAQRRQHPRDDTSASRERRLAHAILSQKILAAGKQVGVSACNAASPLAVPWRAPNLIFGVPTTGASQQALALLDFAVRRARFKSGWWCIIWAGFPVEVPKFSGPRAHLILHFQSKFWLRARGGYGVEGAVYWHGSSRGRLEARGFIWRNVKALDEVLSFSNLDLALD